MRRKYITVFVCCSLLFLLILDTKTVILAARDGLALCLQTVIPSLFPFFIITSMLNSHLLGMRISFLRVLNKVCRLPDGGESLFLLGILGGYPVGAKCINEYYQSGQIDRRTAHRLLGFCSNCGPAFIFGICGRLFTKASTVWFIWGIQIISAVFTGYMLPATSVPTVKLDGRSGVTIQEALRGSIPIMAEVCGWILVFRVILTLANRWLFWLLPTQLSVILSGILELANGCTGLNVIQSEPLRFILCACFLSFGGICVAMQTFSATANCGIGLYFPGKALQTFITLTLSVIAAFFIYPGSVNGIEMTISLLVLIFYAALMKGIIVKRDSNRNVSVV